MGYYVSILSCDFPVPENLEVLSAIYEMDTKFDSVKNGWSLHNGVQEKWFSWMPEDLTKLKTVKEVLEALGFKCESVTAPNDETMVHIVGYDSKTGQEDLFLAVIAPYVEHGSYIEWTGEEGERWKNIVHEGRLTVQEASLVWGEQKKYTHTFIEFNHFGEGGTKILMVDPYEFEPEGQIAGAE